MPNYPALDAQYWEARYQNADTGWDAGKATTPLREYVAQLPSKSLRILVPGAGNAHEAEFLHREGFADVTVLDLAPSPLAHLQERCPTFPAEKLVQEDFFAHQGEYDLILEQTFFCALNPTLRKQYAQKMHQLLAPQGKLVGLLFDGLPIGENPPYGGTQEEYRPYFAPYFHFHTFAPCYNSIPPRRSNELFMILTQK